MKLFGLISGLVAADEIVRYDGDRVYGFDNLSNGVIQHLKTYNKGFEHSFDFWSPDSAEEMVPGGDARIRVKKEFADEFESLLDEFDIDFDILSHNVQHDIDMETMGLQARVQNRNKTPLSWIKILKKIFFFFEPSTLLHSVFTRSAETRTCPLAHKLQRL